MGKNSSSNNKSNSNSNSNSDSNSDSNSNNKNNDNENIMNAYTWPIKNLRLSTIQKKKKDELNEDGKKMALVNWN